MTTYTLGKPYNEKCGDHIGHAHDHSILERSQQKARWIDPKTGIFSGEVEIEVIKYDIITCARCKNMWIKELDEYVERGYRDLSDIELQNYIDCGATHRPVSKFKPFNEFK